MRDLLVVGTILASLPFCFRKPFIGILVWCIIGYVNPHRYTWNFAYDFPVAMLVGAATIAGWLFSPQKGRLPRQCETYMILGLWLIFVITTIFALYPENARVILNKVSKILLMTCLTLFVVDTKKKFEIFILVLTLCVAIFGVKGGIWGIRTGGQEKLWGPPGGSTLSDNNDIGLALNMVAPLLLAFAKMQRKKYLRYLFLVMFGLTLFSVILTYSRGAFMGLAAILLGMSWKSRWRLTIIVILIVSAPTIYALLPDRYRNRMQTIESYDQDASAMGRINAWWFAFNLANARPLVGGGFECFEPELFQIYAPDPFDFHASHSNYFGILGEHGYPALVLYLSLIGATFLKLSRLQRRGRCYQGLEWVRIYAGALQIGLLGYAVSGAFLGRAYFDLFYHFIAAAIILQEVFQREIQDMVLKVISPAENTMEPVLVSYK